MVLSCKPLSARERAKSGSHHSRSRRQKSQQIDSSQDQTFPVRLRPLVEKFYQQALTHPAFVLMTPSEIRQSIENRLWSIASRFPMWFGFGQATKREATEAQRAALEKARQAKLALTEEDAEREHRLRERLKTQTAH